SYLCNEQHKKCRESSMAQYLPISAPKIQGRNWLISYGQIMRTPCVLAWNIGMEQYMVRADSREIGSLIAREIRQRKRLKCLERPNTRPNNEKKGANGKTVNSLI
ncbi:MAG: hypothetical protein D3904_13775, partial [Candidatus Electrothrix sp. EH2]|nr:hypothetical protein [Candidatus Electrothrix sp. EH2]